MVTDIVLHLINVNNALIFRRSAHLVALKREYYDSSTYGWMCGHMVGCVDIRSTPCGRNCTFHTFTQCLPFVHNCFISGPPSVKSSSRRYYSIPE